MSQGRVLIVAGSDSGGGAGIQADIKTVTVLGGFAMTAVTAITVQNTLGVFGVHPVPLDIVRGQIKAVCEDLGVDVVKIGMLGTAETVACVAEALSAHAPDAPIVLDPVMIAKGGHSLLEPSAVEALQRLLLPRAALVTPNAPEAERLTGEAVEDAAGQGRAAARLVALGAKAALVKGGHVEGPIVRDVLRTAHATDVFESPRLASRSTHGTGCTLASAIAASLAQDLTLTRSVERARHFVREAIRRAPGFGGGHGPLAFSWPCTSGALP